MKELTIINLLTIGFATCLRATYNGYMLQATQLCYVSYATCYELRSTATKYAKSKYGDAPAFFRMRFFNYT